MSKPELFGVQTQDASLPPAPLLHHPSSQSLTSRAVADPRICFSDIFLPNSELCFRYQLRDHFFQEAFTDLLFI